MQGWCQPDQRASTAFIHEGATLVLDDPRARRRRWAEGGSCVDRDMGVRVLLPPCTRRTRRNPALHSTHSERSRRGRQEVDLHILRRHVFLVDALGAAASVVSPLLLVPALEPWLGLPLSVTWVLALPAAVLGAYSFTSWWRRASVRPWLAPVMLGNLAFCGFLDVFLPRHAERLPSARVPHGDRRGALPSRLKSTRTDGSQVDARLVGEGDVEPIAGGPAHRSAPRRAEEGLGVEAAGPSREGDLVSPPLHGKGPAGTGVAGPAGPLERRGAGRPHRQLGQATGTCRGPGSGRRRRRHRPVGFRRRTGARTGRRPRRGGHPSFASRGRGRPRRRPPRRPSQDRRQALPQLQAAGGRVAGLQASTRAGRASSAVQRASTGLARRATTCSQGWAKAARTKRNHMPQEVHGCSPLQTGQSQSGGISPSWYM